MKSFSRRTGAPTSKSWCHLYLLVLFSILQSTCLATASIFGDNSLGKIQEETDPRESFASVSGLEGIVFMDSKNNEEMDTAHRNLDTVQIGKSAAVSLYKKFCPQFNPKKGGCGSGVKQADVLLCGHTHSFSKAKNAVIAKKKTSYFYSASRDGNAYGQVKIVCPTSGTKCTATNVKCDVAPSPSASPSAPPSRKPSSQPSSKPSRMPSRRPSMQPSAVPSAAPTTPAPTPELIKTMVPVVWDSNYEATIEFCEDFGAFGYRLPGEFSCGPAGVLIRVKPGYNYVLTLSNKSTKRTNVVFQNLHISASGNANDLYRTLEPDNCLKYHLNIPIYHYGGTHLMLSHFVSELSDQIPKGAYSMLIVEDDLSPLLSDLPGSGDNIIAWMQNEILLIASRDGDTILGNGKRALHFDIAQNEWYRFRVAAIDIAANTNDLVIPDACEARAVAHDGVWRFKVPKETSASSFPMTASDRVDLAMRCSVTGSHNITFAGTTVLRLIVSQGGSTGASPYDENNQPWVPANRPDYLSSMMNSTVDRTFEIRMSGSNINDFSFTQLDTFDYGSIVEFQLKDIDMHPFWMHVHWMQIVSGCAEHYDVGEFYSIVRGVVGQYCMVRVKIADISDKFDVHCSILTHMETGALVYFNVTSGGLVQDWTDRDQFTCV